MKASKQDQDKLSRLPTQAAFDRLRKSPKRWVSEGMAVQILPRDTDRALASPYGLLISVSRKTAPRSVDRSRIRRLLRVAAAETLPTLALPGHDYALIARKGTLNRGSDQLKKDLAWCLRKLEMTV